MAIIVFCKDCGKKIRVPDGPAGRSGACPDCGVQVAIPERSETEPPPAEGLKVKAPAPSSASGKEALKAREKELKAAQALSVPPPASDEKSAAPAPQAAAPRTLPPAGHRSVPAKIKLSRLDESPAGVRPSSATPPAALQPSDTRDPRAAIRWDTRPDPTPSLKPYALALAAAAVLGALGYGLWYVAVGRTQSRTPVDERKRQQLQVPEQEDVWKRLRDGEGKKAMPVEKKTEGETESTP